MLARVPKLELKLLEESLIVVLVDGGAPDIYEFKESVEQLGLIYKVVCFGYHNLRGDPVLRVLLLTVILSHLLVLGDKHLLVVLSVCLELLLNELLQVISINTRSKKRADINEYSKVLISRNLPLRVFLELSHKVVDCIDYNIVTH